MRNKATVSSDQRNHFVYQSSRVIDMMLGIRIEGKRKKGKRKKGKRKEGKRKNGKPKCSETENWETWLSYLSMDHFFQWIILYCMHLSLYYQHHSINLFAIFQETT